MLLREFIRRVLIEASQTGRALERYTTLISREIVNAIKDEGIKEAVSETGSVHFRLDIPEILDDLEWLAQVDIKIQGVEEDIVDADAAYGFDLDASDEQRKTSDMTINIMLPADYTNDVLSRLIPELKSTIRHELEHSGQSTEDLMDVQRRVPDAQVWKTMDSAEAHYLSRSEVAAYVAGAVKKAKMLKQPASDVIDEELIRIWQTGVAYGHPENEIDDLMGQIRQMYQDYLKKRWPLAEVVIREICGDYSADVEDALATAELAHMGQTRRSGEQYIEHPKAVAKMVFDYYGDPTLCAAALLHDALEDALDQGNVDSNDQMESLIAGSFGNEAMGYQVLDLVQALTHDRSLSYDEYVLKLSSNPGALRVKLADMLHNLTHSPSETQRAKYRNALEALRDIYGEPPAGISRVHWADLKTAVEIV